DSVIGIAAAGAAWFGFNYSVLAERAIEKAHATSIIPNCAKVLESRLTSLVPSPSGLGQAFGLPMLDQIERQAIEWLKPRMLSPGERKDRCECAAQRAAQKLRFDYAIHTASFRLVAPQAVSALADETTAIALSGTCGAIPNPFKGAVR